MPGPLRNADLADGGFDSSPSLINHSMVLRRLGKALPWNSFSTWCVNTYPGHEPAQRRHGRWCHVGLCPGEYFLAVVLLPPAALLHVVCIYPQDGAGRAHAWPAGCNSTESGAWAPRIQVVVPWSLDLGSRALCWGRLGSPSDLAGQGGAFPQGHSPCLCLQALPQHGGVYPLRSTEPQRNQGGRGTQSQLLSGGH